MEKKNQIQETISLIMKYNRQMYEYGKDFRSYGTDKMLRVDQMSIINLIGDNPKCNLKLIAQSTDSNISTVSLQVARLVKLGLLEKHRSSMNQREIVLSLRRPMNSTKNWTRTGLTPWSPCSQGIQKKNWPSSTPFSTSF